MAHLVRAPARALRAARGHRGGAGAGGRSALRRSGRDRSGARSRSAAAPLAAAPRGSAWRVAAAARALRRPGAARPRAGDARDPPPPGPRRADRDAVRRGPRHSAGRGRARARRGARLPGPEHDRRRHRPRARRAGDPPAGAMNEWLWAAAVLMVGVTALVAVAARKPLLEGLVALEAAGALTTLVLLMIAEGTRRQPFADLALVFAVTSFAGAIAFLRFGRELE